MTIDSLIDFNYPVATPKANSLIRGSFGINVEHSSPLASLFTHKKVHDTADSDDVFQMIESWLGKCRSAGCGWGDGRHGKLPTRIIDVGPADGSKDPTLTVTDSNQSISSSIECTRYIALSYCWGSETGIPFTTTTSLNIEDRKRGIPMDELPRTFLDAVRITRRLGIRFLWIDSLCILQGHDDSAKAEWATESSKMTEVYGGAYLTIAAASASNVHQGILVRDDVTYQEIRLKLQSEEEPGINHEVFVGPKRSFRQSMDEPLYHRG
ncbi:heterokaryon incompatibility protein-domain-containing protein [Rhexocercosporidium sp. MPI-PUGE-AT-0058]|nr:heterokaryon incompatibility protein-domain-containing protein [Rhexocercosporidium sp. MPI-PUGE-AT-0058]